MNNKINYLTHCIRLLVCGATVVSFSATAQQADAEQDAANSEADDIEIIQVTSSRRVESIQDVAGSVVAVDPNELIQQGLNNMSDLVTKAPGFSFHSGSGQPGRGSVSARGVSQQNDSAVTAIYLDDVPLSSSTGFAAGGRLFFDGLLGDVERVELLKGPQGTLFGATALAGAIRYISREPELYEGRGSITADLSQTKDGGTNQVYRGFYSFPIVEGKVGLTVAGFMTDQGGFVDRVDPATGDIVEKNVNGSEDQGYSADLFIHPNDDLRIRIKAMQQESTYNYSSSVRLAGLDLEEAFGELTTDSDFATDDLTQTVLSASVSYNMDFAVLDVTSSYAKYEAFNEMDTTSLYGPILEQLGGLEPGSVTAAPLTRDVESEKTVLEARLTSNTDGDYEWILGAFYSDESTNNEQVLTGMPAGFLGLSAAFPSDYEETAVFGNLTYYINDNFDITGGLRVSRAEQTLVLNQQGPLAGGDSFEEMAPAKDTVNTYLLTARYRPNDLTNWYARIASGYRPASSNLAVRDPATGDLLSQAVIEQDDLWSYEIGVKGSSADRRLGYEIAAYYIDWDNFQTVSTFSGVTAGANARDGISVRGFETTLNYQLTDDFRYNLGLSYTDSTLNSDEPGLFGLKGESVPNIPKWTLNLGGVYDFRAFDNRPAWLSANLYYKDSAPSAFDDGSAARTSVNVPSDSYTLARLMAGIEFDNTTVTAYINNAFDTRAYSLYNAVAVPGTDTASVTATPLEPRRIGVTVTYSF